MSQGTPFIKHQRVHKIGQSYYILLPKEWLKNYNILPSEDEKLKLLMVATRDIRIVNPNHAEEVYDNITKVVQGVKT